MLVEEQEVWEDWMGQTIEDVDSEWRREAKRQWRATGQATIRRDWTKDMERDKAYDRG